VWMCARMCVCMRACMRIEYVCACMCEKVILTFIFGILCRVFVCGWVCVDAFILFQYFVACGSVWMSMCAYALACVSSCACV